MAQNLYREWFVKFRFPGHEKVKMVDSPLGKIPQGWEVKRLGDHSDFLYGKALKEDARRGGPVPVYGSSGIVGFHDEPLAKAPCIVVGRKGNVGSVFWAPRDFWVIDTAYYVSTELDLSYFYWVLRHQTFLNNDAAVPGLNRNAALAKQFLLPPRILLRDFGETMAEMFATQESCRQRNANLRKTRDLLLPKLISGEVDVSDLDIKVPEDAA